MKYKKGDLVKVETDTDSKCFWKGKVVNAGPGDAYCQVKNLMKHGPDYGAIFAIHTSLVSPWNPANECNV